MREKNTADSASSFQGIVRKCREDVENGRFAAVLERTADEILWIKQPQILLLRMQAALILKDIELTEHICTKIPTCDIEPMFKIAAIKLLAIHHQPELAARTLISAPSLHEKPRFINLTKLILKELKDKSLKKELSKLVTKASGGGTLIKAKPTEFKFAQQPDNKVWGSIDIALAAKTPTHHLIGLNTEVENFRQLAAKGRQPEILEFRDVFTDATGQIWTEKGETILSRSIPIPRKSRTDVRNIPIAFAANRGSQGLYHWLIDYLPGFAWLDDHEIMRDEKFKILLNGARPKFEAEILDIIGLASPIHRMDTPVFVERLLVARVGFRGIVGWSHLDGIFARLGDRSCDLANQHGVSLPDRIYITRRGASRRVLLNETDIEDLAKDRGFQVQDFAEIPIWHQIAIARNAKVIMSPHGAGLSHIVFADPGTKIVEILPIKDGTYPLRFNYARISMMKGHRYHTWVEEQRATLNEWSVDVPAFTQFLDRTLAS